VTIAALDGRALWYLSRGTGAVSLVLLTAAVVLGVVDLRQWSSPNVPRFVVDGLHRTVSLVVVATLAIHIVTSVLDPFAPIRLVDAVLPFTSGYRPVWLGLGAIAFDLLLALVITSLLRARLGYRGWRAVHWIAYACWPVALVHGLGTGSDVRGRFLLPLSVACAAAVALAIAVRLASPDTRRTVWRVGGFGALTASGIALVLWLPSGPLAQGWAARAGTPAPARRTAATTAARAPRRSDPLPARTPLAGRISEAVQPNGSATATLALDLRQGPMRRVEIHLEGTALAGGGLSLTGGQVTLGTAASPERYSGAVSSLQGNQLDATLTGPGGRTIELSLALQINRETGFVGGVATLATGTGG
jgi:methionine sulfoxide reductase heme-binding subunit